MMQKTQFFLGDKSRILKSEKFIKKDICFLSKWQKRDPKLVHGKIGSRRSISPVTRKLLKNMERTLINRPIVKTYSKRWKQTNKPKNINEKIARSVKRKVLPWSLNESTLKSG